MTIEDPTKKTTKIPVDQIIQKLIDEDIPLFVSEEAAEAVLGEIKMKQMNHTTADEANEKCLGCE